MYEYCFATVRPVFTNLPPGPKGLNISIFEHLRHRVRRNLTIITYLR